MYYAIMHDTEEVIAKGETFRDCVEAADATGKWGKAPGTAAPYFYTTEAWFTKTESENKNEILES